MRLLVLGGTQFVGHAAVAEGLARGWDVTVANRGLSGPAPAGSRAVALDRTQPGAFDALAEERFDVVLDTWSQAPRVVRDAARALASSTDRWVYVSSRSVYSWPIPQHGDETAAVVEADPDADATDYAADKRGAELALERELGVERVVHVRAGLGVETDQVGAGLGEVHTGAAIEGVDAIHGGDAKKRGRIEPQAAQHVSPPIARRHIAEVTPGAKADGAQQRP